MKIDNIPLLSSSINELQKMLELYRAVDISFGFKLNAKKSINILIGPHVTLQNHA